MPDLLGVTNPVPGYENNTIPNRNINTYPNNTQVQNIVDPNRVTRPDNRTQQQDNNSQPEAGLRYDSNYQTFLQRLQNTPSMTETVSHLFTTQEGTVVMSGMSEGMASEMSQAMQTLHNLSPEELVRFLSSQFQSSSRFGGALFALLRGAYANATSETVRGDILQFLKSYTDFASSSHIEGNLLRSLGGMADAMPASYADKLRELIAQLQNSLAAGDRQGSVALLQRGIFPFMSAYVDKTHDMGLSRSLLSLLTLDAARYENGSEESLLRAFHQLSSYGTLRDQLGGLDDASLLALLRQNQAGQSPAAQFADHLANATAMALRGEGSTEVQQALRSLVNAMLVNESVYMPVNHYLLPLSQDNKNLFSELWVDPNDEQSKGGKDGKDGKPGVRLLFKMDVQGLGTFDILMLAQDKDVSLHVSCPQRVALFSGQIQDAMSELLRRNDFNPAQVSVQRMDRPLTLTEVFPKIYERKNSVNVKV